MLININGAIEFGVTAKDITMFIIGKIGTAGGTGHVIEYSGEAISSLSMEGRMTLCNMAIEAGARAGMVAPDDKTSDYVKGRPLAPKNNDFIVPNLYAEYPPINPPSIVAKTPKNFE